MTATLEQTTTAETVADLLERLGGVPPSRVRVDPPLGIATEQHVIGFREQKRRLFELVDGVLVEKPVGVYESIVAGVLIQLLRNSLSGKRLGTVTAPDGMMRLRPGLIRIPDVAFIRWDRLPNRKAPHTQFAELGPDIAIEVLSPSNTRAEMALKTTEYFEAGSRQVWLFDPETRSISVYSDPTQVKALEAKDILEGGDILPGFSIQVQQIFDLADEEQDGGA